MAPRGGIRFPVPPKDAIVAAGGLCAPVSDRYALPSENERPIRNALIDMFAREQERQALPPDERPAFDMKHRGYAESGRPDVAARVAEFGYRSDDVDETPYQHEWDEPIRLRYAWRSK